MAQVNYVTIFFIMKTLTLYLIGIIFFFPITSNSQTLNKDSIAFVHSYGQIDENNPLSISLANTLYHISINAKNKKYPSFYGGAYIKNDSITLLIAQKVPYIELANIITSSVQRVNLEKCDFSYRELLTVTNLLENLFFSTSKEEIRDKIVGWQSFYLSIPNNKIIIRLYECTKEKIQLFKKYFCDYPMFLFIKADEYIHI